MVTLVPVVAVGYQLGYRSPASYPLFAIYALGVTSVALRITLRFFPDLPAAGVAVRTGVIAFAAIVAGGLVLGTLGLLTPLAFLAYAVVLCAVAARTQAAARRVAIPNLASLPVLAAAAAAAFLAFAAAHGLSHPPRTLYDSLSYHLFFPARWLQDHRVSIIPTPFSDEAQAYAPANGELFFLSLMLPFHGDLLARVGQVPFGFLCAITSFALARRLGAEPADALLPAAFLFLSRPIAEQLLGANVDLICASLFSTSLYLGIEAADRNRRRDWLLWGTSVGLFCGTKYLALVYVPVLLTVAMARGPRPRSLWGLPGIAAFGLPWYVRNWVAGGSPIYPASLEIAGRVLARGAFDRAAMIQTVFHAGDVRFLPVVLARAIGPTMLIVWMPLAVLGGIALVRRGWWPGGFVVLATVLMVPLYWFGVPVNTDARFLMPAVAPALVPLAFVPRMSARWAAPVHVVYLVAVMWALVGFHGAIPFAGTPWYMRGWLALDGLLMPAFIPWFVAVMVFIVMGWQLASSSSASWAVPLTTLAVVLPTAALAAGARSWCRPSLCDYVDASSPSIRPTLISSWEWMDGRVVHATVAYTGINLPYPLAGPTLSNRVVYVNIDGHPRWRFHDYDRAYRSGRFRPSPPYLAKASGELMTIDDDRQWSGGALRPRYERLQGDQAAWIGNLQVLGVTHVFIAALSAYEVDYVWHNAEGFPIEDEWAKADPRTFEVVYENRDVRIYAVDFRPGHRG
jgi:hypothetical protein